MIADLIASLRPDAPVLIAGPTASGKSALALAIAEAQGGVIVNADASQVYDCWRVLTARPSAQEEARAPHRLYGHLPYDAPYSTGHWLREVAPILGTERAIFVGGTGLYFTALTEGLAEIPATPAAVRTQADAMDLNDMRDALDASTAKRIDLANRARVQRAWEVLHATGRGLADWQDDKTEAILPRGSYTGIVMDSPKDWLTPRIEQRFAQMLDQGGLEEARTMQDRFDHGLPSCRAIGVAEAMGVLNQTLSRAQAIEAATIATRRYAKRQRTWFRARMGDWHWVPSATLAEK
ncbi:tRNA (adenosine(37)-N6)-dimethylallyltransferase MiaA [uncultured Tateyamaria sp.]|uniref:tRNA (adenosine(37)-N6)-dimethylallyltransferase MiaA n=1 Tax=uncultured Tateyamaria sp. TaxID=455651 RepID=UPI0026129BC9|nr:tRNA (adenosine(37)-N6)-dimethylallyltransferase MiaA [uncultured Tateyamaria sp.]